MIAFVKSKFRKLVHRIVITIIRNELNDYYFNRIKIFGDSNRLILKGEGITLNNTFFNCNSGHIFINSHVGIAHNCMVITGSHDFSKKNEGRSLGILDKRDIVIEEGVFIGSGSIILGPCKIGRHAVIGAGSVVTKDIPENVIAAGNPCKVIKEITFN